MHSNMKGLSGFNGKKLFMTILGLVVLGLISSFTIYELTKSSITLVLDGEEQQVKSHADTVQQVLEENGVKIGEHDLVAPSKDTALKEGMEIQWDPAKKINVTVNGETKTVWTTKDTIKEAVNELDFAVKEHDEITPSLDEKIQEGMDINYESAFEVTLNIGGKEQNVWTTSTTVADLLKQHEVTLGKLDRVEPEKGAELAGKAQVNVIRVEKVTDVVEEPIDYQTVTRKDSSLLKGKEKLVESGEEGRKAKHFEVILENGKEVSRKLVKEEVVKDSKNKVVAVGTKVVKPVVKQTVSRSKAPSKSSKEFYVRSTAYTANCSGCSGITATGFNLKANPNAKVIAVDPGVIPLGTKVYVEGYGYAIAADTGGAIRGNKIDVFFSSKSQAYAWGNRTVKVKIIN
ncbi:ubiquitin-like domain-containing protein [Pseudalkalibacillus caeni]